MGGSDDVPTAERAERAPSCANALPGAEGEEWHVVSDGIDPVSNRTESPEHVEQDESESDAGEDDQSSNSSTPAPATQQRCQEQQHRLIWPLYALILVLAAHSAVLHFRSDAQSSELTELRIRVALRQRNIAGMKSRVAALEGRYKELWEASKRDSADALEAMTCPEIPVAVEPFVSGGSWSTPNLLQQAKEKLGELAKLNLTEIGAQLAALNYDAWRHYPKLKEVVASFKSSEPEEQQPNGADYASQSESGGSAGTGPASGELEGPSDAHQARKYPKELNEGAAEPEMILTAQHYAQKYPEGVISFSAKADVLGPSDSDYSQKYPTNSDGAVGLAEVGDASWQLYLKVRAAAARRLAAMSAEEVAGEDGSKADVSKLTENVAGLKKSLKEANRRAKKAQEELRAFRRRMRRQHRREALRNEKENEASKTSLDAPEPLEGEARRQQQQQKQQQPLPAKVETSSNKARKGGGNGKKGGVQAVKGSARKKEGKEERQE